MISQILASLPKNKREDAIWLFQFYFRCSRAELFLRSHEVPADILKRWQKDWKRRLAGEPLQYIVGEAPFYGRDFFVSPAVLIPRPETESLVELGLGACKDGARVLDLCTGSGVVAISLKLERPSLFVTGTDISAAALRVAKKNSTRLAADVNFERADLFSRALQKKSWDLVISNPPYLHFAKDYVAADVKKWEPKIALEPTQKARVEKLERAAWCGEKILAGCASASVRKTVLELSPRVSLLLFHRWKKHPRVETIRREADLAGRKRFLLVAWKDA